MTNTPKQLCLAGQSIEPEAYPRPDGSVYICGSPEHIALPNDPNTIQADPSSIEDLKEVARSVSSKLADAPLEVGQSCFLPLSPDGLPVMGKVPGVQGAYIASGVHCHGHRVSDRRRLKIEPSEVPMEPNYSTKPRSHILKACQSCILSNKPALTMHKTANVICRSHRPLNSTVDVACLQCMQQVCTHIGQCHGQCHGQSVVS